MGRACIVLLATSLAGPAGAADVSYWLWDAQQKPAYEECAKAFQAKNPGIQVRITQAEWSDYWANLEAGFASGSAPDVFVDHPSRYPELVANARLLDLAPLVARDQLQTAAYAPGLLPLWQIKGRTYGLPKDWDTVALVYNAELLKAAGVTPEQLRAATWNPRDGGEFGKLLARLTVDDHGKRGDEPGYDRTRVKQYGLVLGGDTLDGVGQTSWAGFAAANGFRWTAKRDGARYRYQDPKLAEAIQWLVDASVKKGHSAPLTVMRGGGAKVFLSGRAAIAVDGAWMIGSYVSALGAKVGFAPLPQGPAGRKTVFNGVADSIWAGSKVQKEAWEWVKFLGSPACQDLVASRAVVFPALTESGAKAKEAYAKRGVDVSAFLEGAKPESAVPFPLLDHAAEVNALMRIAMANIFMQKAPAKAELARISKLLSAMPSR